MSGLICGNCHQPVPSGIHPYTIRIELFPRIEESLEITSDDLGLDFDSEMKKIIENMEAMSEEERALAEEKTFTRFTFILCPPCRDWLAERLKEHAK